MVLVCFKIFDTDRDGFLSEVELRDMLEVLVDVANNSRSDQMDSKKSVCVAFEEIKASVKSYKSTMSNYCDTMNQINNEQSNDTMSNNDNECNNIKETFFLSQEHFLMWSVETTSNLVQPFLHLLFEVCHIVLGLRPQCCHQELEIGNIS